jgi:hypothetical protein
MNIINKHFDKVYVITTSLETERQSYILEYLSKNNIEYNIRVSVPYKFLQDYYIKDLWNSEIITNSKNISLCLCYLSIFKECLYNKTYRVLIFEDDIIFENDYIEKFERFMSSIKNEWDILNFGYHYKKFEDGWKYFEVNEFVSDAEVSWTTHMVAFNKELTLRNLSDKIINSTMPIDYIINYFTHICKCLNDERRMVCYIPNEIICKQLSYRDDENKPDNKVFKSLII